jgi:hypothetical protein
MDPRKNILKVIHSKLIVDCIVIPHDIRECSEDFR